MVAGVDRAFLSSEDLVAMTSSDARGVAAAVHRSDVEDVMVDDDAVGLFTLDECGANRRGCHRHTEYELHRPLPQIC